MARGHLSCCQVLAVAQERESPVAELFDTLVQLFQVLGKLLRELLGLALQWALLLFWMAWWLWAANWRRIWPVLAQGAWVPLVLILVVGALVWSQILPGDCNCLGFVTVANFWWQLGAVGLLTA